MYKLIKDALTGKVVAAKIQIGDVLISFPFDPANTDYQEYLAWLAEGNEPLPADEPA